MTEVCRQQFLTDLLYLFKCTILPFIVISWPIEKVHQYIMSRDWDRKHSIMCQVPLPLSGTTSKLYLKTLKIKRILQQLKTIFYLRLAIIKPNYNNTSGVYFTTVFQV